MYNKKFFGKNLKFLREKYGVEQQELAEELGRKSGSTVSDWERGKATPNTGILTYIANKFGVTLTEIMETDIQENEQDKSKKTNIKERNRPLVPIVGGVVAGKANYAVEDIEGYMTLPPDKQSADGLIYLKVTSDSMNRQFPVNSYVLVDTYTNVENGNVAVVKINGNEATLKQVKFDYDKGQMFLIPNSHNEEHFPEVVDIDDGVSLVGKVIGVYMSI